MLKPSGVSDGMGSIDTAEYERFAELYPRLRRLAAVVGDRDLDPDDLVQDALVATLRRHRLTELEHPEAYLRRAIINASANHRRRAGRWRGLLPRLVDERVTTATYPSDLAILDSLDPLDRVVVYLADVEGQPHQAIAELVGLSSGAVRKRVSRARARLRAALSDQQAEELHR